MSSLKTVDVQDSHGFWGFHLEDLQQLLKFKTQLVLSIYPEMISVYYELSSGLICKYHRITHVRLSKHVHLFNILQENHLVQHL